MTSMAGTFTLALDPTTHFGFSEDGSHTDYDLALSPRSDDIRAMMGSNDFPYDLDTAGVMNQKQNMTKAQPLTGFEQCASAFPANPQADAEIYNSPYHMETTISWESDCMMYTSLPQRMVRYTSPLGSCGGDQSTSDSSMSEYSWNSPKLYPSVNDVFDSPITEKCQFSDGIDNALSRSLSGSQFGSECSVSPKDVQHYPDPVPTQSPTFEDLMLSNKPPRSIPAFMSQSFSLQNMDSRLGQDDIVFGDHLQAGNNEIVDPALGEAYLDRQNSLSGITSAGFSGLAHKRVKYNEIKADSSVSISSPPLSPSGSESGVRKNRAKPKQRQSPVSKRTARRTPSKSSSFSIPRNRQSAADRIFSCVFAPYGCTSSFASKNEWKRHVLSQHLQLGFYRCDIGHCKVSKPSNSMMSTPYSCDCPTSISSSPSHSCAITTMRTPNDFNRKDLFTQHLRRMHAPWLTLPSPHEPTKGEREAFDKQLDEVRARCWVQQRQAPQRSQCNYCSHEFVGPHSWEDRMEHVGKHCEVMDTEEREDIALREWAIEEGVILPYGPGKWLLASILNGSGKKSCGYSS
ncbi:hypothetical protein TMEN_6462 [Trichophyton mentagrophytes]|uniref:C2H2 finger domain-containing protein n=2 Tax=Trichophyton interdigitale TaxID=101480 RepID=A0A9P4YLJ6_9EURO|nr:C2H2 finger domain-containing protein [Trichophyton interdigitale]KAF3901307.1 C2H2 finger domain-containing protein [Trichophyton interdigitale]KAG8212406.1 C2H2 finger domain-containing protein [Trichophyton interdigitale]KDB23262.1 hypothetical protein H109_04860 [Trichophyton interdigitale MR816]GBF63801.1 hypothetical protein TMEN_6462 [Trichophyton mentagrophytes]